MKVVLLPGLDGTADLFDDFIFHLGLPVQKVCYPMAGLQTYSYLIDFVKSKLPLSEDYIILGESFSGPIAAKLASENIPGMKGAVFVATFIQSPNPKLVKLAKNIPVSKVTKLPFFKFWSRRLIGSGCSNTMIERFGQVMASLNQDIIAERLDATLSTESLGIEDITMPALYLQAKYDFMVPKYCEQGFEAICKKYQSFVIKSSHFVLQSEPKETAERIRDWLDEQCIL